MPCYLCCISSSAGIPVMCKKRGDIANLPFPIQAALNGTFVFGKSFDVRLLSLETASCQITWREFHESVTLILISGRYPGGDTHIDRLLDTVWDAMVLSVGWDDLTNIANVERVKRQLKGSYRLVDRLLDGLEQGQTTFCDLTGLPDVMLIPTSNKLQVALELVTESADSTYGCLLVHGRLAVATRNWSQLTTREQCLLALYVRAARGSAAARDVSIFLPVKSPHVPFRLLVCRLSEGSDVVLLCGPTPSLEELERQTVRHWGPVLETVRQQEVVHPRGFPTSVLLDPAVHGFVLESRATRRCASSANAHHGTSERHVTGAPAELRLSQLRHLYRHTAGQLLPPDCAATTDETCPPPATETYLLTEKHHGYALRSGDYTIYVLFQCGTSPHMMRGLARNTLQQLTSIKQVRF